MIRTKTPGVGGMIGSLLDTILDRTVVAGYTRVGYRMRRGIVEPRRAAADGREGRARHRRDLRARPRRRRGLRAPRRHRLAARPQRAARRACPRGDRGTVGQRRRSGRPLRPQRPQSRAAVRRALQRRGAAPGCARQQRGRAARRADALGRRHRADLRDQRPRAIPADEPADPAAREERARPHRQRVLGRHVHAAHPPRRPADGPRGVRRPDRLRAHQARPGDPDRAVGGAAAGHRRRGPRDASRLGGHPGPESSLPRFYGADKAAAAHAAAGRRHDRLARRRSRAGAQLRRLLA